MAPEDGLDRRTLLSALAAAPMAGAPGLLAAPAADRPAEDRVEPRILKRIAFGSCAHQDKEQPIWDAVLASRPDLFILLGDNIYADTRDPAVMAAKYQALAEKPGFRRLRATVPLLAVWDDHDYGENDAGADYPMKEEARRQFLDFWGEPADSVRRDRDGIYAAYRYGPKDRCVQIVLPDLRWNRTGLLPLELGGRDYEAWARAQQEAGKPVPGPYARNPGTDATMLGERQWAWLEGLLAQPADLRILGSSLQVVADFPGWEGWINFAQDHQRLLQAIRTRRANGLLCISGDTHYGELSRLDVNVPYPLWDLTSSGLTEVWPVLPPNARRVGAAWRAQNFGLIDIDWRGQATTVDLRLHDVEGTVRLTHKVALADLRV